MERENCKCDCKMVKENVKDRKKNSADVKPQRVNDFQAVVMISSLILASQTQNTTVQVVFFLNLKSVLSQPLFAYI